MSSTMIKRICYSGAVFLCSCWSLFSQNDRIDSLKGIVEQRPVDSVTVTALNALSVEILGNEDIDGAVRYSSEAIELADSLKFSMGKAYALKNRGMAEYYRGDYLKVLDYWTRSLETFESINDTLGIANMVNNLGAVYYNQGSNTKAIEYYLRSLDISEKLGDPLRITTALLNVGGVYADNSNTYDKALTYFEKINPYLKDLDNPQIVTAYFMGVGEIYFKKGDFQTALKYYQEALPITQYKMTTMYANNLTELGKAEFELGERDKAIDYLNRGYQEAKDNDQQLQVIQSLIALGRVYQEEDPSKALTIYQEAESLAKEINTDYELRDIYQGLAQTYASKKDNSSAYKYLQLYIAQKDSLFNLETDDKIRGLQFDFDLSKKEDEIGLLEKEAEIQALEEKRQKNVIFGTGLALVLIILLALGLYRRYRFIQETNLIIEKEKNRSENLLLNILPEETALELKENGKVKAKKFESVTVLFTDFVGFTSYANNLKPEELVSSVDYYFSRFDAIMEKHDVEKIKTIGDAYMAAGGLPHPDERHVFNVIEAAFEIIKFIDAAKHSGRMKNQTFDVRVGINTGPIVAGVVGTKKFAYDIWGDTVNVASRMETKSKPGKINVSESTYELLKDHYECEYRGEIDVKNKGMMKMFFVNGPKISNDASDQVETINETGETLTKK